MTPANLLSDEQLETAARTPDELMSAAIAAGTDVDAVYGSIEDMWRRYVTVLNDWASLTRSYLAERKQPPGDLLELRPERVAELAARSGGTLDRLRLANAMLDGGGHELRAGIGSAVAAGDKAGALETWANARDLMAFVRALRLDHINDLLACVHREYGEDGLRDAMLYAADRGFWRDALPAQPAVPPEELILHTAFFLSAGAGSELRLLEEQDRFVVEFRDCHCRKRQRAHEESGWDLPVVKGPSDMTYGQPEMTPFQSHYAVIHGAWAIDAAGQPVPPFDCFGTAINPGEYCRNYVYKTDVPERFYAAVGRTKPT